MTDFNFDNLTAEEMKLCLTKMVKLIETLQEQLNTTLEVNAALGAELKFLRAKPFSGKTEHLSEEQMLLFSISALLDDSVAAVQEKDITSVSKQKPTLTQAKPRKSQEERWAHLVATPVLIPVPEAEMVCPCCAETKVVIGSEVSRQLEYKPASLSVTEYHRLKVACRRCAEFVSIAPAAPKLIKKGTASSGLIAQIAISKYCDHLPLSRQENIFARMGTPISRSSMCDWLKMAATKLAPLVEAIRKRVLQSGVIWTDDTRVKLKESIRNENGIRLVESRMWTYKGDTSHPFDFFDHTRSRRRDGPKKVLSGFRGILQADAYAGYDHIYTSGEVVEAACMAHVRRKFYEAISSAGTLGVAAVRIIDSLYHVEHEAEAIAIEKEMSRQEFFSLRLQLRKEKSFEIMLQFERWLSDTKRSQVPESPISKAINYTQNNWDALFTIFTNGEVTLDNNFAEGALRRIALGRKNYLFFGNEGGGQTAACFYTLIASAIRNELEPFAYLKDVLHRLTMTPDVSLNQLMPDAWKPLEVEVAARNSSRSLTD